MAYCWPKGREPGGTRTSPQDRSTAIDSMKATPENKNTKRRLSHEQAVKFLNSWLDWFQNGDPILEALQRLKRLIQTLPHRGKRWELKR